MAWKGLLLNGFLSIMDMKQHLMMGTEMANCCDNHIYKSARSLSTREPGRSVQYYTNPVISTNAPDPSVTRLADGSGWVAVVTSDHSSRLANPNAFPIYFSSDLVTWTLRSWVFTSQTWPAWARDNMWAPELHNVNGRYILYFTATDYNDRTVIGAAIAQTSDPFGPYLDIGRPLITSMESLGGAIDPHYFKDPRSGRDFLLWKEDVKLPLPASIIYIRELQPSGIFFKAVPPQSEIESHNPLPGSGHGASQEQPGEPPGGEAGSRGPVDDVQGRDLLPLLQQRLDHGDEVPHQGGHVQESHGALLPGPHARHHHRLGLHAAGWS